MPERHEFRNNQGEVMRIPFTRTAQEKETRGEIRSLEHGRFSNPRLASLARTKAVALKQIQKDPAPVPAQTVEQERIDAAYKYVTTGHGYEDMVRTRDQAEQDRQGTAEAEANEPPVQIADPTMLAVERSLPEGPERDAFRADREAGTLRTCEDRAAEADIAEFEKYYGEPPTPAAGAREAGE